MALPEHHRLVVQVVEHSLAAVRNLVEAHIPVAEEERIRVVELRRVVEDKPTLLLRKHLANVRWRMR